MRTRVKFCGCTSLADANLAVDAGADAVGFIFAESPRRIALGIAEEIVHALPPFVTPVGVLVDPSNGELERIRKTIPEIVLQISRFPGGASRYTYPRVIEVIPVAQSHARAGRAVRDDVLLHNVPSDTIILFDTKDPALAGGSGKVFAWDSIVPIARERRIGVAGGLTPENVGECIRKVRPYFVDVRSGIETAGKKDAAKMRAFVAAVGLADKTCNDGPYETE